MNSRSATRQVSHHPRDTIQAPRFSSRLKNKWILQTSKRSVRYKGYKAPKIIKSLSSFEKSKLAKPRTPETGSWKKDDSDESKSNSLSKMSFWGSLDLSIGVEILCKLTKSNEDASFLIMSMNLCNVRNMIQLPDQDSHDVASLFSCHDLSDPIFQDSIIKL